jgi:hypothetical protein
MINVQDSDPLTQKTLKSVQIPQSEIRNPQLTQFSDLSDDLFCLKMPQADGA